MRICVFGYSGFLGGELVKKIPKEIELILPSRKNSVETKENNRIYVPFNIENNISYKPDISINLIGILKETKYEKYEDAHVKTVEKIVDASIKNRVKKIIHISAYGVYKGCDSRYFKTKEKSEEIIKNSGLDYFIVRPSVIFGEGQKLISDLRKITSISPIIFAPSGKVAPVNVLDVVNSIIGGINGERGTVEVLGDVTNYKDMFKKILSDMGVKRVVIKVPNFLFLPLVLTRFFMKEPLMTYDLYKIMNCDYYDKK